MGISGKPTGSAGWAVLTGLWSLWLFVLPACGNQDPAFTEDRDTSSISYNGSGQAVDLGTETENPNWTGNTGQMGEDGDGAGGIGGVIGGEDGFGFDADGDGGHGGDGNGGADGGGYDAGGEDAWGGIDAGGGDDVGGYDAGGEDGFGFERVEMELVQQGPGKVDILWIVDSSGSMAEEQTYLGNNFHAFISELAASGHDFQTAVTSTDVCQDTVPQNLAERRCPGSYGGSTSTRLRGKFRGSSGQQVLKQGQADLISKFTQYVNVGTNGSGFEHGLTAAKLAVEKVLDGSNDPLLRNDAHLAIIVVSDEEDDGIGLGMTDAYTGYNFVQMGLTTYRYTHTDLINYLKQVKGAGKFSISAITGTRKPNGQLCSAPHSQPLEEGTQYIAAANATGGIVQSICETDWSVSLGALGFDLDAQITQVTLEYIPYVASIQVYVNGVETSEWTYNAGNNAVKFNAGHVPEEGDEIRIVYYRL